MRPISERPTPSRRRLTSVLALSVAVVVALTGCLPGVGRDAGHSSSPTTSARSTGSTAPPSPGTSFRIPTDDGVEQYAVKVTALYRSGPFMRMGFTVTCEKAGDASTGQCEAGIYLSGAVGGNYGGFYLVDPVAHKEYLPVMTEDDAFTSEVNNISAGKSDDGWAVFPAVDKTARTLDVVVKHGPVLENTPIGSPKPETQKAPVNPDFDKPKDTTDTNGLDLPVRDLRLHTTSEGTEEKQEKNRKDVTLSADVLFAFAKADLTPRAESILRRVATQMDQNATGTVQVTGYTDAKGSPKVNDPLSKNRAKAVADYLRSHVRRGLTYAVAGKGERDPVAPNANDDGSDNPKGRAKNRRVTISYTIQPPTSEHSPSPSVTATTQTPHRPQPISWVTSGANGDDTYRVAVQQVRRHDDMAALQVNLTCEKSGDPSSGCWQVTELNGGIRVDNRAGGFKLYEPRSKTHYYPVIDSEDVEWAIDVSDELPVDAELSCWIYFPAPDPGVTAVDVELPHGGPTVHDVPVV